MINMDCQSKNSNALEVSSHLDSLATAMKETTREIAKIMDDEVIPYFIGFCNLVSMRPERTGVAERNIGSVTASSFLRTGASARAVMATIKLSDVVDLKHAFEPMKLVADEIKSHSSTGATSLLGVVDNEIIEKVRELLDPLVKKNMVSIASASECMMNMKWKLSMDEAVKKSISNINRETRVFFNVLREDHHVKKGCGRKATEKRTRLS